jgi:outer membrane lipoprotein-sorting protein
MSAKRKALESEIEDVKLEIVREVRSGDKHLGTTRVTIYRKKERIRIESNDRKGSVTAISDGKEFWVRWPDVIQGPSPISPYILPLWKPVTATQSCRPGKPESPCLVLPRDPISIWHADIPEDEARILGEEKIGNRDCWILETGDATSYFRKLWIDKELFAAIRWAATGPVEITITWDDFREVAGLGVIPHLMREKISSPTSDTKHVQTFTVKSIRANVGLQDNLFDPKEMNSR